MQIKRGYRTELDLKKAQITACKKHAGAARYAYNWGLKRKQEVYQATGRSISAMELHRELNQLKQTEVPWMDECSKAAPQEALRDLDEGFTNFEEASASQKRGQVARPGWLPQVQNQTAWAWQFQVDRIDSCLREGG